MVESAWRNLVIMFFDQAERFGERPMLWAKNDGRYRPLTWRESAAQVTALARGFRSLGVERGDRIVLVAENRPEWTIADLAIMAAGAITVPAYTTNTEADHLHILENSGARGIVVSNRKLAAPLLAAARRSGTAGFIVVMENLGIQQQVGIEVMHWSELMAKGEHHPVNIIDAAEKLERDDIACLVYTSGTGGAPKGVMLHHGAILHNCEGALDVLRDMRLSDEVFLSFLPLSHAYEHTVGQFFPIMIGAEIYYAEGMEKLSANLVEVRPTIMTAVPRLYEVLHQRVLQGIRKTSDFRQKLFRLTLRLGQLRHIRPGGLSISQRLGNLVLDLLVRRKIRARFGGRLKAMVSGGAPLNPEIALFFSALGLPVLQGYGQTEAGPLISVNRPGRAKMHTVGPPIKGIDVKIADDGEILVRGPMVMKGYWRNELATREAIRDGWLHTGDIGELDVDGHIVITDRKKDIIINSGGDNLSPARIEGQLTLRPEIAQAMAYGDRKPHVVALIVPDEHWLRNWAREHGKPQDLATLSQDDELRRTLSEVIDEVNRSLSVIEKVRRFAIASEPFSVDNGQLTATMKIRRHVVRSIYGAALEALYGDKVS
jgi:long-chain acyl-CoA synthetase